MTECSLQTSQASTAAYKTSASAVYEPRLSPVLFADPIWTRNEQQVQCHPAPEEYLSPLTPAAKPQVAVDPLWSAASTSTPV